MPVDASVAGLIGAAPRIEGDVASRTFDSVYEQYFDFVWRNIRRLGVPEPQVDDAVQEVFLVVHKKLAHLDRDGVCKAWIFAVVLRVAYAHRRSLRRKSPFTCSTEPPVDPDQLESRLLPCDEALAHEQGLRLLHEILEQLDNDKRTVFVLAEFEEMSVPEIAAMLGANVNTVYARLRAARKDFDQAAARLRARTSWRTR